jgi:hypothetical protein
MDTVVARQRSTQKQTQGSSAQGRTSPGPQCPKADVSGGGAGWRPDVTPLRPDRPQGAIGGQERRARKPTPRVEAFGRRCAGRTRLLSETRHPDVDPRGLIQRNPGGGFSSRSRNPSRCRLVTLSSAPVVSRTAASPLDKGLIECTRSRATMARRWMRVKCDGSKRADRRVEVSRTRWTRSPACSA